MLEIEERLFDEYKIVDKICRDIFQSQSGVNQYIAEMDNNFSHGISAVPSWKDDYYRLKHIRWLRNQIAHESSVTDCNEDDAAWLETFHHRLLERQDPLALLKKSDRDMLVFPRQNVNKTKLCAMDYAEDNAESLEELRKRLLEQAPPLELLGKSNNERLSFSHKRESERNVVSKQMADNNHLQNEKNSSSRPIVNAIIWIEVIVIIIAAIVLLNAVVMK